MQIRWCIQKVRTKPELSFWKKLYASCLAGGGNPSLTWGMIRKSASPTSEVRVQPVKCESYQWSASPTSEVWVQPVKCESYQWSVSPTSEVWVLPVKCESYQWSASPTSEVRVLPVSVSPTSEVRVLTVKCESYQWVWVLPVKCESYQWVWVLPVSVSPTSEVRLGLPLGALETTHSVTHLLEYSINQARWIKKTVSVHGTRGASWLCQSTLI